MTRYDADRTGSEVEMLEQFLDLQREALLAKTEELDQQQMARRHPPSSLTLGGLLHHLSLAEEDWLELHFSGQSDRDPFVSADWSADPDWQFHPPGDLEPEQLRQRYRDACERSRAVVRQAADLSQLSARPVDGSRFSLRWVLLHLIEETARHVGHADLLREAIDGRVG